MTTSMTASGPLPYKTIGRLSQYRRLLGLRLAMGQRNVYSHELAAFAGVTAAQVRRDLMIVGAKGSPTKGYDVHALIECLGGVLDDPAGQRAALVGIGNLGRALLTYFHGRRPKLSIVAAFDVDAAKTDRVICGCRCYTMDKLAEVVVAEKITVGILTVPASEAQHVAAELEAAGVSGLLNFAPQPLRVGPHTYAEDLDMTMTLERVAYFARRNR
ncbi:MAG: redox-sensing transcriptional repressor Rex [Planctomycetes bacterium]|nr:redox-sensing transcriptional repressor Rex [Planctomycetota bacterium]